MAKQPLTQSLSKRSLASHTWLGLLVSAFMYLICLSGTVAVLHLEFERWEQPYIEESDSFSIAQVEKAYAQFAQRYTADTHHYYFVFPGSGIPRLVMEDDNTAHFVDANGDLIEQETVTWTRMLGDLHMYLHLPATFGMIFVSTCGALLCALIVSGLLAHPRIVKDAFRFRAGGDGLKSNIDLHNRLSVWGTPFHLMIAVTGAYFGLAGILVTIISQAFYGGDNQAVYDQVFTPEPVLEQEVAPPEIGQAMRDLFERIDRNNLIFFAIHDPGTPQQFIEFFVKEPGRFTYSENYQYNSAGQFLSVSGYGEGDGGKQILWSVYRLHFGDFWGMPGKVLFIILGMMLTIISATGMNIWLKKRKTQDALNLLWPALIWGTPSALVASAAAYFAVSLSPTLSFWVVLCGLCVLALTTKSQQHVTRQLKQAFSLLTLCFLLVYFAVFGEAGFSIAALQINIPLLLIALWTGYSAHKQN
ncbi:PepSY domain-containing protein [Aestuariibacter sp. GS-14]|uniref:PepSY-associated TM helix domain-containing protein n=1 Tax=Aestuariibacter sp. GS-14 TaxID=2590670 RepID=UPI00112D6988|nr:PepSY-associated TM helix domain-containing protein [Aestuariibacter sp. GS-14]TPV59156.1 PepSY domain-containing protein [Aestuariibacter sp. GS-14]